MKYTYNDYRAFYFINRLLLGTGDMEILPSSLMAWVRHTGFAKKTLCQEQEKGKMKKLTHTRVRKELEKNLRIPNGAKPSLLSQNIHFIGRLFHLSQIEKEMLEGCVLWKSNRFLRVFAKKCLYSSEPSAEMLAALSNMVPEEGISLLLPSSPLIRYGLLAQTREDMPEFRVTDKIKELLAKSYVSVESMRNSLLGYPLKCSWTKQDFSYIPETDFAVKLIKHGAAKKGFNILLYGTPGTGKTSFAQMLAATAKRLIYPVGERADDEHFRNYRLQALRQKNELLAQDGNACLLFDEAEDLFSSRMTACNKVEINRLLEDNRCPVIWTTNDIQAMDPAFIRRFTLAVCFKEPPVAVRQKIWRTHLKSCQLPCSFKQTLELAKEFIIPPSMIKSAAQAACMVKGDLNTVRCHVSMMLQAMHGGVKLRNIENKKLNFNAELVHSDMDLSVLTERLKMSGKLNFSLCLYGQSGTGKSAYARYLAAELGLKVQHKRASDLISKFVGETEENIASAFALAEEEKSLLIFDEADSFLQDRSRANYSWEISAVNEMLTWMERHPYPFICTTNLIDTLDPASLRRFSFKVKYDLLMPEQIQRAFKYFFNLKIPSQQLYRLSLLTPGDFAVVKNKAEILGVTSSPASIIKLLEEEQTFKRQGMGSKIGFSK